ncbi:unnamed protein product [Moneuplotes crassus]|uniref:Uncharacterized protein n=2 Tax=Euplotes crassus TaxID=5936 RepID=A0AAD1XC39_EUPCR|nr:unnamed protein product [Moneuplotes crassus]
MADPFDDETIFQACQDNPLLGIDVSFSVKNHKKEQEEVTEKDGKFLADRTKASIFSFDEKVTLIENMNHCYEFLENVKKYSQCLKKSNCEYLPGDAIDKIKMDFYFQKTPNYWFYPIYSAFVNPNYHYFGYNLSKYPKSSLFKKFDKTQLRFGFGEKWAMSFHQFFKEHKGYNIEFSSELSRRDIGINAREYKRETGVTFHKYLSEPSVLFPLCPFVDENKEYFCKIYSKRRSNEIDTNKASTEFLDLALNQDRLLAVKVGYLSSKFKDILLSEGHTMEVSGEFCTDQINSKFLHFKSHYRRFHTVGNCYLQTFAKYDKLLGLGNHKEYSINDRILLRNFKGVRDVGKKYHRPGQEAQVKDRNYLPTGDCLGHTHALELGLKITSPNLPIFGRYQLDQYDCTFRPFVFTNLAILPDEFKKGERIESNILNNSVASAGIGLQFIHKLLSAEMYYSVAVHKHDYEFGTELQFNFGLD